MADVVSSWRRQGTLPYTQLPIERSCVNGSFAAVVGFLMGVSRTACPGSPKSNMNRNDLELQCFLEGDYPCVSRVLAQRELQPHKRPM